MRRESRTRLTEIADSLEYLDRELQKITTGNVAHKAVNLAMCARHLAANVRGVIVYESKPRRRRKRK